MQQRNVPTEDQGSQGDDSINPAPSRLHMAGFKAYHLPESRSSSAVHSVPSRACRLKEGLELPDLCSADDPRRDMPL